MSLNLKSTRNFLAKFVLYSGIFSNTLIQNNVNADVLYSIAGDEVSVPIQTIRGSLLVGW